MEQNDKQPHFKIYNGVNKLIFVTPVLPNLKEKLAELTNVKPDEVFLNPYQRSFFNGYRIECKYL